MNSKRCGTVKPHHHRCYRSTNPQNNLFYVIAQRNYNVASHNYKILDLTYNQMLSKFKIFFSENNLCFEVSI